MLNYVHVSMLHKQIPTGCVTFTVLLQNTLKAVHFDINLLIITQTCIAAMFLIAVLPAKIKNIYILGWYCYWFNRFSDLVFILRQWSIATFY